MGLEYEFDPLTDEEREIGEEFFKTAIPLERRSSFYGSDESLAAGLKREMDWAGLSVAQVAQKAKVAESEVARILTTGRAHPTVMIDVFKVFGVQLVSVPLDWEQ